MQHYYTHVVTSFIFQAHTEKFTPALHHTTRKQNQTKMDTEVSVTRLSRKVEYIGQVKRIRL